MPKRFTGRRARLAKTRTDKRFSAEDRILTNVFVPNSGVFMPSGTKVGLVSSPSGQIGQPLPQGGDATVSDELLLLGPNTSGDTNGAAIVIYDASLDAFNADYNDLRTMATAADAFGCGATLGSRPYVIGTSIRDGFYGTWIRTANTIYRVDARDAVTDLTSIAGYGLVNPNFGGAAGDLGLFFGATNPYNFQVFDFAAGTWGSVIAGPAGINGHILDYGSVMWLSPAGVIWTCDSSAQQISYYSGGSWTTIPQPPDSLVSFVGYGGYIAALSDTTLYALYRRGSSSTFFNVAVWDGATWTTINNTNDLAGIPSATAFIDAGDGQHYGIAYVPGVRRLYLIDLVAGTVIGDAIVPNVGFNPNNTTTYLAASSLSNIAVYRSSNSGVRETLFSVAYSQALFDAKDKYWSLVGGRSNGHGTFTDPDDTPVDLGLADSWWYNVGAHAPQTR